MLLVRYLRMQVHYLGCSKEELEEKYGIPMLNRGKFIYRALY